ncbi:NAD(P)-binding protein [Aspergillus steynii IBT 23096]|uniref:NAD(P)-binding protein n=1 Tax=Aspergillus steynii IBT 23096 TaxID=1392250 RepID=A0A2I2GNW2_9EURO|nr:NAD(P)-binding protein [Aspergillus steynii IBT 23096]PLB54567.1 NAD(P)-binding protein [Aspergillus steynii IBT 23096]
MASVQIALAGATGNLGRPILEALLGTGYNVTVLSRIGGNSSKLKPHPSLVIKEVDFSSVQSLTPALRGVHVVISCLATLAIGSQNPLIDASVEAGVKRFIPAEFGMDSQNPLSVQLPVCAPKAATQKYLLDKSTSNPEFTFTGIANGLFLDWCLENKIILDLTHHTATLYNGGDVPFSATTLADVAKGVLGVIQHQAETANRIVYIHSAVVTQNRLIQYAEKKDGKAWQTAVKSTDEVKQESFAELAKGAQADIDAAMLGFCILASWSPEYGCDFSAHLDNELLGVRQMDEAELRALVERLL